MTYRSFLVSALGLVAACGGDRALDEGARTTGALQSQCLTDGDFDFVLTAAALAPWDGHAARAVAFEPASPVGPGAPVDRRPADVSGVVHDGRFVAVCPHALRTNYAYPSAAVFVDVDEDGRCDAGDVGLSLQLYGWDAEFITGGLSLPETSSGDSGVWQPVETLGGHIGLPDPHFCSAFFD